MKRILSDDLIIESLLVIAGLIYFHSSLVVYALLLAWLLFNCCSLIVHEGWSHNYIIPKNKFIRHCFDIIGNLTAFPSRTSTTPKKFWLEYHTLHHAHWKSVNDMLQWGLNNNNIILYLFTSKIKKYKPFQESSYKRINLSQFNNMDKISKLIDSNWKHINLLIHLGLLIALGLEHYFYFVFFQVWFFGRIFVIIGEIIPHYKKTKEEERDAAYLFPLITGNAYHTSHHRYRNILFLGTGWLKYINIQYYFIKLFYNINPKVSLA